MTAGKRILVTGANGFVGSWLCGRLCAENDVVALVRDPDKIDYLKAHGIENKVEIVGGDITRPEMPDIGNIDYCIHLAARRDISECNAYPDKAMEVNVNGVNNVLSWCKKSGTKGFVLSSSSKIYGSGSGTCDESSIPNPDSVYASTKLSSEWVTRSFSERFKIPFIIARITTIYGPLDIRGDSLVQNTMRNIRSGIKPMVYGDGRVERDFVYVKDISAFFQKSLDLIEDGITGTFNIGTGRMNSILDVVGRVSDASVWEGGIEFIKPPWKTTSDKRVSIKKAMSVGWNPEYDLERGIRETVKYG